MNINFELYKIFYVVANNNSISKGAEVLMISQPAVTQSIKNLENQLNTTLFIRTKKGIVLTPEGKELYNYIKEGMYYFINGTNKLEELKNLKTGTIKIGASTTITENILMPYIKQFTELYPNIDIIIKNELTDNLIKELNNGNLDIVVGTKPIKEINNLSFHKIKDIHYTFISNKEETLSLKDIQTKKLIIQSEPSISRSIYKNFIKENNLIIPSTIEVVSHHLLQSFVKNNQGIGFAIKEYITDKDIKEITIKEKLPTREIGYLIVNNYTPTYATKKFIELLKK